MATTETAQQTHERSGRRRPFSTWMKKLTNFKAGSSTDPSQATMNGKRHTYHMKSNSKKQPASKNNNPYPESGQINGNSAAPDNENNLSFSTVPTANTRSSASVDRGRQSISISEDGRHPPTIGNKSSAPTVSTDVAHSDAAPSHGASSAAGTSATIGGGVSSGRGADSTFSSPAPSVRSLTTTLTTIQSAAPPAPAASHNTINNTQSIHFTHQFPTSPPTALPPHLAPQGSGGHPATYSTATANNLLTDNASILTLASSSKRRRRRSMDTDASVRALAPSSLFGGSRESLPLSVLSANIDSNTVPTPHQARPSVAGLNERASIYSATGVAPALPSERNSYYAGKQSATADGGSVRSGLLGHGRNDSVSGSIGGGASASSPLASPPEFGIPSTGNPSHANLTEANEKGAADTEDGAEVVVEEAGKA